MDNKQTHPKSILALCSYSHSLDENVMEEDDCKLTIVAQHPIQTAQKQMK